MLAGPAVAVCDLQAAGLIERLSGFYRGDRQWALHRLGPSARAFKREWERDQRSRNGSTSPSSGSRRGVGHGIRVRLPCSPRCRLRWGSVTEGAHNVSGEHRRRRWRGPGEKLFQGDQREIRPEGCNA